MGGENDGTFAEERGPWLNYDLVEDVQDPGGIVGVRRKEDPDGPVFTPLDLMALENPLISGDGILGTKGAML